MEHKIQILSLREFVNPEGRVIKHDRKHFKAGWRADSIQDLFANFEKFLSQIPERERWNIYYTACRCKEDKGRIFVDQNIIPIDVDGIDRNRIDKYIEIVGRVLGLDLSKVGIIDSGNGLQFIILLEEYITNQSYFDTNRAYYKAMCGKINTALFEEGLIGSADPSVFSTSRLLRFPFTENRKKDKGVKQAELINANIEPIKFNLVRVSGLPELLESDHIHDRALLRLPKPDTAGVLDGCNFLKHCKENQETITEPEWYAMLSIVGRLEDGHKLVHEYSEKHQGYNPDLTDMKMNQALEASGPRTCGNIQTMYDGCVNCPHYKQIKSPIMIRGEGFLVTKDTGFWDVVITKEGKVKRIAPNYEDLIKFYDMQHKHVVIRETELIYKYTGKYWEMQESIDMAAFVEKHMQPAPNNAQCKEFIGKMKRTNLKDTSWMTVEDKINLQNGVVDVRTGAFTKHDDLYGFPYVLPFNYDEDAVCPQWEKFIEDVTMGEEQLVNVLQEFMGLCLGFVDPTLVQKSAILIGSGANGKSVYLNILKKLIGDKNYSVVPLSEASANRTARTALVSKMANITEETPNGAFLDSSFFKDIVSGGEIEAHKMYHGPFKFKSTAKIIMACNSMPTLTDVTNGMLRRILLIPFRRTFSKKEQDPLLSRKLEAELSGIFNWALTGLRRLQDAHYQFSDSDIIDEKLSEEVSESNPLFDWCLENLEVNMRFRGEPLTKLVEEYRLSNMRTNITNKVVYHHIRNYIRSVLHIYDIKTKVKKIDGVSARYMPYIRLRGQNDSTY